MVHSRRTRPRPGRLVRFATCLLLLLAAAPPPARAQAPDAPPPPAGFRPRIVRQGTVSLHGAALYGTLLGSGRFAETFSSGLGLGFALRYRSSQESSLGLGFEAHRFDAKVEADSAAAPKNLQLVVTTLDYTRHFNVRTRSPRYLVIGAGLMQSRQENNNEEKEFPGDGGVFKLGGGFEYWINRTLTVDFGVRYYGVLSQSQLNHDVQAGLGFAFYTSP
jgi:opacity protein-like surface antigen